MKVLAPLLLLVVLLAGSWLILSKGPGPDLLNVAIVAVFFVLVSSLLARIAERRPELKTPLRVTFLVVAIAGAGFYVWDSHLRPKSEKNEAVATADVKASELRGKAASGQDVELASGGFEGVEGHDAEGQARVIELASGGKRLVFEDFEVTQGPDLRVYLVEGDGDVSDSNFEDAGSLKGERGRFQYEIDDVDTERYRTVVIWCRAFSVPFGEAALEGS